ncbi:MAG: radical SAM protein [Candidatus Pacearchaeota archaeon]|nr:radical SAM protein [Candidatus Pacearchaeota archaeon]
MKKVSLMYPNFEWAESMSRTKWFSHPYNIGILASMIQDKKYVEIIDANIDNLSREQFSERIRESSPNILGISITTNEYAESGLIAAKIAKKTLPDIKIVVGGVGAMSNPYPIISDPNVDYEVVGEGEYAFRELCEFLDGKGNFPEKGVWYKENGKVIERGRTDFIQDLDSLPFPSYHLVDFMKYATQIQRESVDRPRDMPYARIVTSRGCPFNCSFCEVGSISGKKVRFRNLENISREIEWMIEDYGIKALSFDDDNLTVNKERAKELFKTMIERKYNLKWNNPATAVFKLDDEMLDLMKESGCAYLGIAIESGNQRVLNEIIHKPVDLSKAKETIGKIKERGIDLAVNFIVGFPGETWEEIRQTFRYAQELNADYCRFFIATPLPNTELYRMAKEKGLLREGFDFSKHLWSDGWIKSDEFRHQDLRVLRAYEWDRINFSSPEKIKKICHMLDITEERLNQIRKETLATANP